MDQDMSEPQVIYVKEKSKTGCLTQVIAALLLLLLVGFIVSLVSESGSSSKSGSSQGGSNELVKPPEPDAEVSEIKGKALEYGGLEITGIVKNKHLVSLDGLVIRFSIFDSRDNKIGEAIDSVSDLDAGESWKFKATASESGAF